VKHCYETLQTRSAYGIVSETEVHHSFQMDKHPNTLIRKEFPMIFRPLHTTVHFTLCGLMALGVLLAGSHAVKAAGQRGKVTGRSVGAGALSLIIWPGIGQAVNDQPGKKVATHAIIGLLPPYRLWSAYDALFDRQGGYWEGKI
jgi:hypothetical protein